MLTLPPEIKTLLGFAQKSGALESGDSAVSSALKRDAARIVILAGDLPEKRRKHWENWCENRKIRCAIAGTKEEFGQVLGRSERGIIAVTDSKMAAAISQRLNDKI